MSNGANVTRIAFAGHGLGAHLSGQVGYNLTITGDKLGWIYGNHFYRLVFKDFNNLKKKNYFFFDKLGLDPAKYCFKANCDPMTEILDASDAHFVEIYHTDERFLGTDCHYGCFDYKLNGGDYQPGCYYLDDLCNHRYAYRFFAGIIRQPRVAHSCFDAANNHTLGIHGQNETKTCLTKPIFFNTKAVDPFCSRATT